MACCCQACSDKSASSCLGRCVLRKHRCLEKEVVKPGPVPKYMGWMYCARDSPEFQQRCGWRPGHISCPVLRKIEAHNGSKEICGLCPSRCSTRPSCSRACSRSCLYRTCSKPKPCIAPPVCSAIAPPGIPLIRIIRHRGQYEICTKPSNLNNSPHGPFPLKYVLNTDSNNPDAKGVKYSVEAKFNDYHFDYTSSQSSFILDFSPPGSPCAKPCPNKSVTCMYGLCPNSWIPAPPATPAAPANNEPKKNPELVEAKSSTESIKSK